MSLYQPDLPELIKAGLGSSRLLFPEEIDAKNAAFRCYAKTIVGFPGFWKAAFHIIRLFFYELTLYQRIRLAKEARC